MKLLLQLKDGPRIIREFDVGQMRFDKYTEDNLEYAEAVFDLCEGTLSKFQNGSDDR